MSVQRIRSRARVFHVGTGTSTRCEQLAGANGRKVLSVISRYLLSVLVAVEDSWNEPMMRV